MSSRPSQSIIANRTNLPFTIDGYGVSYGTTSNALQLASQDLQRFWAGELTRCALSHMTVYTTSRIHACINCNQSGCVLSTLQTPLLRLSTSLSPPPLLSVAAEVVRRLANFGYIRTVSLSLDELSRNMILAVVRGPAQTGCSFQRGMRSGGKPGPGLLRVCPGQNNRNRCS